MPRISFVGNGSNRNIPLLIKIIYAKNMTYRNLIISTAVARYANINNSRD